MSPTLKVLTALVSASAFVKGLQVDLDECNHFVESDVPTGLQIVHPVNQCETLYNSEQCDELEEQCALYNLSLSYQCYNGVMYEIMYDDAQCTTMQSNVTLETAYNGSEAYLGSYSDAAVVCNAVIDCPAVSVVELWLTEACDDPEVAMYTSENYLSYFADSNNAGDTSAYVASACVSYAQDESFRFDCVNGAATVQWFSDTECAIRIVDAVEESDEYGNLYCEDYWGKQILLQCEDPITLSTDSPIPSTTNSVTETDESSALTTDLPTESATDTSSESSTNAPTDSISTVEPTTTQSGKQRVNVMFAILIVSVVVLAWI